MDELLSRVNDLVKRTDDLEDEVADLRRQLLAAEAHNFALQRALAANGIPDPTREA